MCREEEHTLSIVIQVGRKIKDSQDEDYVPWKNTVMEEQPKVDEQMCVDINDEFGTMMEVGSNNDEDLMGNLEFLVLHEGEMLEATKETSRSPILKHIIGLCMQM